MTIVRYVKEDGSVPVTQWLGKLRDIQAVTAILRRFTRIKKGNFGDHKSVGGGIWELRVDTGPGYRVYYSIHGDELVLLLCGGDKSSQQADIAKATEYRQDYLRRMQ